MSTNDFEPGKPVIAFCIFRVRPGAVAAFDELLARHWPTLRAEGLVTDAPPLQWRLTERDGAPVVVEVITWASPEASARAHEHPGVMAIWDPMGEACEQRGGKPAMEFLHAPG